MIDGRGGRRRWRALALLLAVLVALAACGSDDDDGSGSDDGGADSEAEADLTAYLRPAGVPADAVGTFDPTKARTRANVDTMRLVYDTLMRPGKDGELEPGLAESAEVVDQDTFRVELKEGITFSDGTPFDAEAVKLGLERNLAAKNLVGMRAEIFDITRITIDSPTTLTIDLGKPVAGAVVTYTAGIEMVIVAPSAHADPDANPIGAGPFILEEFVPNTVLKMKKNPTYFEADKIKVAGLDFVPVPTTDATALTNGLRSGQIDIASKQGKTIADAVVGEPSLEMITELDPNSVIGLVWCKSRPPLDDVRVRRALALATDREAINEVLFDGQGEVSWGMWPEGHPFHDPDQVGEIEHDPDEAKRLLAQAGYPNGFEIGMLFQYAGDPQRAGEILQQQWSQVGVRLSLHSVSNLLTDFYQQVKQPILVLNDSGGNNIVRQYSQPNSIANVCQYDDPAFVEPLKKLPTLTYGSDEYIEQFHEIDRLANELMVRFPLVMPPSSTIYNERVGGVRIVDNYTGSPIADLFQTYIKKS